MNALEFAEKYGVTIDEIETFLEEKHGTILFSRTYALSAELLKVLTDRFAPGDSGADKPKADEPKPKITKVNAPRRKKTKTDKPNPKKPKAEEPKAAEPKMEESPIQPSVNDGIYEHIFGKSVETFIKEGYHIMIDTCSILRSDQAFKLFYERDCRPWLKPGEIMLKIPYAVYAELAKICHNKTKDAQTRKRAEYAIKVILEDVQAKYIQILGDGSQKYPNKHGEKDYFADPVIVEQMLRWRNDGENALLITQEGKLKKDVFNVINIESVNTNAEICVKKLDEQGRLIDLPSVE